MPSASATFSSSQRRNYLTMGQPAALQLGFVVDTLSTCGCHGGKDVLLCGLSNFWGPEWTGKLALVAADGSGISMLASSADLPYGVAAATALPTRDLFTGRIVLATGGDDGSVALWDATVSSDLPELQRTQAKIRHDAIVSGVAAGATNSQLATCSWDGTLRLWDCEQLLSCTGQLVGHRGAVHAVAWQPGEGSVLVSAGQDGTLKAWDTRRPSSPVSSTAAGAPVFCLALPSHQSHLVLAGDQMGQLSYFDLRAAGGGAAGQPALSHNKLFGDAVRSITCRGAAKAGCVEAAAAGPGADPADGSSSAGLDVAAGGDDGRVLLLTAQEAAAGRVSTVKVAYHSQGPSPTYARALAWGALGLYRGGWDAAIAPIAL